MSINPLQVTVEQVSDATVVHVSGDITAADVDRFRQGVAGAISKRPARIVIDLTGTSFLSSPGLAVLVQALQLSQRGGSALVLAGANDRVRGIFEIARLTEVFKLVPTLGDAIGH